jgi:hypothetical protein
MIFSQPIGIQPDQKVYLKNLRKRLSIYQESIWVFLQGKTEEHNDLKDDFKELKGIIKLLSTDFEKKNIKSGTRKSSRIAQMRASSEINADASDATLSLKKMKLSGEISGHGKGLYGKPKHEYSAAEDSQSLVGKSKDKISKSQEKSTPAIPGNLIRRLGAILQDNDRMKMEERQGYFNDQVTLDLQ